MAKLLHLKHWQLFMLLFGIPIIFHISALIIIFSTQNGKIALIGFPLMLIFFMVVFFGWFYTLGSNLVSKLPGTVRMSLTKFRIFLLVPVLYILLLFIFMAVFFSTKPSGSEVGPPPNFGFIALIIPVHLFSMFCIFYCMYFISKALKVAELQKPVTSSDYIGDFLLFWFSPVGEWILQPRINKLFNNEIPELQQD